MRDLSRSNVRGLSQMTSAQTVEMSDTSQEQPSNSIRVTLLYFKKFILYLALTYKKIGTSVKNFLVPVNCSPLLSCSQCVSRRALP